MPVLLGGVDNPQTNAIEDYPPNTPLDEWMIANDLATEDLADTIQVDISGTQFQYCNMDFEREAQFINYYGDPNIPNSESYDTGFYLNCAVTTDHSVTENELATVKLYAFGCSQPLAIDQIRIPVGGVANAADGVGGTGGGDDLCADPFYQSPKIQPVNWAPANTLNIDLFLPVLTGGAGTSWGQPNNNYPSTPLDDQIGFLIENFGYLPSDDNGGDITNFGVHLQINGETASEYCTIPSVDSIKAWPVFPPDQAFVEKYGTSEPGIFLNCKYTTDRDITDLELASVSVFAFGCEAPLETSQISIPPKELEVYTPPEQEVSCEKGEHLNQKGKCVPDNACNAGDVYASSEGVCCAPSDYDATWDSCNPPFYTP
jgi:hypothetical protein